MYRLLVAFLIIFTPLFAKEAEPIQSCGCPEQEYYCDPDANKRALPGPVAAVVTSIKNRPGAWTIAAAGLAVGGLAYALSNSSDSTSH